MDCSENSGYVFLLSLQRTGIRTTRQPVRRPIVSSDSDSSSDESRQSTLINVNEGN